MVILPISVTNIGTPFSRNGSEVSWLLNGKHYIINLIDAIYLSMVGLGKTKFDPARKIMGYKV